MSDRGELRDTYAAALQHDLVDLEGEEWLVGVVRRPLPWFHGLVDENLRQLGPPETLLEEFKARYETLGDRGYEDAEAHNQAILDIDYPARYRDHLETSSEATAEIERLVDAIEGGTTVVLVCYENTESKRCHRTLLKAYIQTVMDG